MAQENRAPYDIETAREAEIDVAEVGKLSEALATSGVTNTAKGSKVLATSDDVAALGAGIGLIAQEALRAGQDVARTAGELWAVGDIVALMRMPVLAGFLESRGERLQQVAAEVMLQGARATAVSRDVEATSGAIAGLGIQETAEGIARMTASEAMARRIEEVALAGAGLVVEGTGES